MMPSRNQSPLFLFYHHAEGLEIKEKAEIGELCFFFLKILFIYLFIYLEGKGGGKKEGKISVWLPLLWPSLGTWPATQARALTRSQTSDPLVHSPHSIH